MEHARALFFRFFFISAGTIVSERDTLEELSVYESEDVATSESEAEAVHGPENLQHLQESEQCQE